MKTPESLPEPLRYLGQFVGYLAKQPPESWNEDVDASRLEKALRKRIAGLDPSAASKRLRDDRKLLAAWLKSSRRSEHPAHWVLGYLMSPRDLAEHLAHPKPPPASPTVSFDRPEGWKVQPIAGALTLKKGRLFAVLGALDDLGVTTMRHLFVPRAKGGTVTQSPDWIASVQDVNLGPVRGSKSVVAMHGPVAWKQVKYLLAVPGGHVLVDMGSTDGADFDESPIESRLHTLRVQPH